MSRQAVAAAPARALPDRVPLPLPRPSAPRRVSGPVRRPLAAPRRRTAARVLDAPVLERLLRGRVWIAIVGVALLGIVAMQVAILRLGASIGASVTRIQQLEQSNQSAETQIARLQPGGDVANTAAKLGMLYPPAGDLVYLNGERGTSGDRSRIDNATDRTARLERAARRADRSGLERRSSHEHGAAARRHGRHGEHRDNVRRPAGHNDHPDFRRDANGPDELRLDAAPPQSRRRAPQPAQAVAARRPDRLPGG